VKGRPSWDGVNKVDRASSDAIRALLEERFGLVVTRGGPNADGYALRIAPGGLKLSPTSPQARPLMQVAKNGMDSTASSMDWLAASSEGMMHAPVVDETGVRDLYDFHLSWGP